MPAAPEWEATEGAGGGRWYCMVGAACIDPTHPPTRPEAVRGAACAAPRWFIDGGWGGAIGIEALSPAREQLLAAPRQPADGGAVRGAVSAG